MDPHIIKPIVRVLCLPDVDRPIGGVKQLFRHVEHLISLGFDAAIVTESEGFYPTWFSTTAPTISLHSCLSSSFNPKNGLFVIPETYIGVNFIDFFGYDVSCFCSVVFNQNVFYTFGSLGTYDCQKLSYLYDRPSVLHVLCVSEDSHHFLSRNLAIQDNRLSRIINSIDPFFSPNYPKKDNICWMPRKNPEHVNAILSSFFRGNLSPSSNWSGISIDNFSHSEVASTFNDSKIYLSFGHPEGFGLPVAEAMASGNWVIGYSGGGARELFRLGASDEISFGDWPAFHNAIERVINLFVQSPREANLRLRRQSLAIKSLYSVDQEHKSIEDAWTLISLSFQQSLLL